MTNIKPVPDDVAPVIPHLVVDRAAAAIEFYKQAFGAIEEARLPGPEGKLMHAQIRIRGGLVMLADEFPDFGSQSPRRLRGSPVVLHLYVEDADAAFARAVQAGAKVVMPLADMFWGDRYGQVEDPFGHRWSLATQQREVSPEQWPDAMRQQMPELSA